MSLELKWGLSLSLSLSLGTVTGTKMAPPYATIFMGDLVEKLLNIN